jgi:ABC-2 type transport system permease protein
MLTGKASMPGYLWVLTGFCVWAGSLVFAAFGLFMGYLLPAENVMQFLGIAMTLLAFGGGLFIPIGQYSHPLQTVAEFTPLYGLNQLVHTPLLGGSIHVAWAANAAAWLAIFAAGAIWRFRQDTARV